MKRFVDREHLEWVSTLPCCICGTKNQIQVHHLLKPYSGKRGVSMRAGDDNVIPLCFKHHTELHTKFGNEEKFFIHYGYIGSFGKDTAKNLYESKTIYLDDDDLPF